MSQEPEILSIFAERVRQRLESLGWSVSDLARKMGVPHQAVQRYVGPTRKNTPGLETAEKIAQGLGVPLYELLAPSVGGHPIDECYRRIGEVIRGARAADDRLEKVRVQEALKIVRETLAALSREEQDSFLEDLRKRIGTHKG